MKNTKMFMLSTLSGLMIPIGWVLGALLFVGLLYFYNKSQFNKVTEKEVDQYIMQTKQVKLTIDDFYNPDIRSLFFTVKGKLNKGGGAMYRALRRDFYNKELNKYFTILFIDAYLDDNNKYSYTGMLSSFLWEMQNGETITAWVNQPELNNPLYGTKENPIPIFKFERDEKYSDRTFEGYFTNSQGAEEDMEHIRKLYPVNVHIYLAYMKSKEEFARMFPESASK